MTYRITIDMKTPGARGLTGIEYDADLWSESKHYPFRAALKHDHKIWYALQPNIGIEPGTDPSVWLLFLEGESAASLAQAVTDARNAQSGAEGAARLTAEDRDQTKDDRRQTGEDREQTRLDRIATGEDRSTVQALTNRVLELEEELRAVGEIVTDVAEVASVKEQVSSVAEQVAAIMLAAAKITEIEAAPGAAQQASEANTSSQKWAEGEEPGGPGTMSSKAHALAAAASAGTAAAATLIGYGVSIYNADGIEPGTFYAERRANASSVQDRLYAEIVDGEPGSQVSVVVVVGGVAAYGPILVAHGAPVSLEGLAIPVSAADGVSYTLTPTLGAVREVFVKTYGAVT